MKKLVIIPTYNEIENLKSLFPALLQLSEKFDILVVQACSVWKLLTLFPKIFKGKHLGSEVLRYIQSGSLKITTINSLATNIDGELKGHTPFEMKVHKNKVRVFVKNQK